MNNYFYIVYDIDIWVTIDTTYMKVTLHYTSLRYRTISDTKRKYF